ncbi:MAG: hypothetical protein EBR20_02150 [Bacteroidetes bacterium]|nr:hypothetical protein [Bacteroidota bacterium]
MDISQFATRQSYRRADTVREAGEYAIRGSIVDIFPPGADDPVRIDFFDTEIETIKKFDAETQRSTDKINAVTLHPVSEFVLDEDTIAVLNRAGRIDELSVSEDVQVIEPLAKQQVRPYVCYPKEAGAMVSRLPHEPL